MKDEQARAIGEDALIWLAGQTDVLEAFLAASGAAPESLRGQAADADFLAAVIDFLLSADETVIAMADAGGRRPEALAADLMRARAVLGGAVPGWT